MKRLKNFLQDILQYPSAIFGSLIVLALVIAAIVVVIKIPYSEAINTWRGGEQIWGKNPRNVPPKWVNWFRSEKLVESMDLFEDDEAVTVTTEVTEGGTPIKTVVFEIDFQYDTFPQDLVLYFTSTFDTKQPFVNINWVTPDGREIKINGFAIGVTHTYPFTQDDKLKRRLDGLSPVIGLFNDPEVEAQVPLKGKHQLVVEVITFEPGSEVQTEFVMHGQVFGWFGTDHLRRD